MNVPQLRFSGFEGEWEEKELNELLEFKNGINADKDSYGHGAKFINVLDILNNDYILSENIIGSVNATEKQLETYSVTYGDILFLRSSETREDVGICNVYLDQAKPAVFGGFVIRGKKIADYSPFFLKTLLNNSPARNQISSKAGGSTRYNVGQTILSEVIVRLPQIEEQQKISSFLMLFNQKIEKQQEKIEKLEKFKKGMMQKIFTQELRFKDEDGGEFGEWEEKTLNKFVKFGKAGGTPLSSNRSYYNGEIPFLSIRDMTDQGKFITNTDKYINEEGLKNSSAWIVPSNSLIYSMYASVGFVCVNKLPISTSQAMYSMILKDSSSLEFLYYYLSYFRLNGIRKFIETGTQGNLNANTVKNILVPTPILKEQKKIGEFLSKIDMKIEKEKEKLMVLEEQKRGFMWGMFV